MIIISLCCQLSFSLFFSFPPSYGPLLLSSPALWETELQAWSTPYIVISLIFSSLSYPSSFSGEAEKMDLAAPDDVSCFFSGG